MRDTPFGDACSAQRALIVVSSLRAGAAEQARNAHADHLAKAQTARDAERTPLPPYWTPIGPQWDASKTLLVPLSQVSREFKSVADRFHATCPEGQFAIDGIQRVQNFDQWGMFVTLMKQMRQRKTKDPSDPGPNVQELFHGTDEAVVAKIAAHNFNRSFGKVQAYGAGVYFAQDAAYSAQPIYSKPNPAGQQFMILAKVLVGHSTLGNAGFREPPARKLADGSEKLYDSLVDPAGKIIVSCHRDYQAYAEHVITFRTNSQWRPRAAQHAGLAGSFIFGHQQHAWAPPQQAWAPPQQAWAPPQQAWAPPQQAWAPPQQAWAPPQQAWTPPQQAWAPSQQVQQQQQQQVQQQQQQQPVKQYEASLGPVVWLTITNNTGATIRITDHVYHGAGIDEPVPGSGWPSARHDIGANSHLAITVKQHQMLQAHALDMWNNPISNAPLATKAVNPLTPPLKYEWTV